MLVPLPPTVSFKECMMNAPFFAKWILLATPLVFSGCRTASTVTPIGGTVEPGGDGGGQGALLVQGQGTYDAPPHTFSPRPHPAHRRSDAPAPNLALLPKLVDRIDRCYGVERKPSVAHKPGVASNRHPTKPNGGGYQGKYKRVQYGQAGGAAPTPVAPTVAINNGPLGKSGGQGDGGQGRGSATPTTSPSAPKPDPVAAPRRDSKPMETKAADADASARARPPAPLAGASMQSAPKADMEVQASEKSRAERRADRKAEREAKKSASGNQAPAAESAASPPMDIAGGDGAEDESMHQPVRLDDPRDQYKDWGQAIYLSNDDTMSLSSAQRVIFAIDKFLPLPLQHIRPHELLNYFSFETAPVSPDDDFSVLADIAPDPKQAGIYNLALAIKGRPVDLQARRNANLTFVVDRSGSMSDEGRMDYLKRGMKQMMGQLKTGDLVNVVLFDHEECTPIENFVVGRDRPEILTRAIEKMAPRGSTDVHLGLTKGYELADRDYQPTYNNRVVLITDALANTGDTDPRTMSLVSKFYDSRKIRLSGVGVGREFNDELLDKLTERGKGAYVFLGSEAEVDAVFGARFISLLETTAMDVHFQLHLPPSLRMNVFYGEESSVVKEDVQAIHYFANTSQLFLSDLMARGKKLRPQDQIMLTIEYEDPESGQQMVEERAFTLGDISREAYNIRKGRLLIGWADRLALMASRPQPMGSGPIAGGWVDPDGFQQCEQGKSDLRDMAQGMNDPEVNRVLALWDKYCSRYEQPRNPTRRVRVAEQGGWPSAK